MELIQHYPPKPGSFLPAPASSKSQLSNEVPAGSRHHIDSAFSIRNTREKADYSTFYVSAIISKGFPAIKSLGSFR
jgi:hypothetical protein